jgi:NADH-quinone oxidoreductase subunit J
VAALIAFEMVAVLRPENFDLEQFIVPIPHKPDYSNTKELGNLLYTVYVYPFELASVILLVAIVAAIALTLRRRTSKFQDPVQQVRVQRQDRVRLIKMTAEKIQK